MTVLPTARGRKAPLWFVVPFVSLWCFLLLRVGYLNLQAFRERAAIRQALNAPDAQFTVLVNGEPVPNSAPVLAAIRTIHLRLSHHTYPTQEIPVAIRSGGRLLELTLARDSGVKDEYWVFWARQPKRNGANEIGRIQTPIFGGQ